MNIHTAHTKSCDTSQNRHGNLPTTQRMLWLCATVDTTVKCNLHRGTPIPKQLKTNQSIPWIRFSCAVGPNWRTTYETSPEYKTELVVMCRWNGDSRNTRCSLEQLTLGNRVHSSSKMELPEGHWFDSGLDSWMHDAYGANDQTSAPHKNRTELPTTES